MVNAIPGNWVVVIDYENPEDMEIVGPFSSDVDAGLWIDTNYAALEEDSEFLAAFAQICVTPKRFWDE